MAARTERTSMLLFPFFENIEGRRFLIVGGGRTAKQKLSVLRRFTDRITVVAEDTDIEAPENEPTGNEAPGNETPGNEPSGIEVSDAEPGENEGFRVIRKRFDPDDLSLGDYIIAATSDRALNKEISDLSKAAGKPVNVVDDAELCTFFFPALIRKGGLVVGVSTSGQSPAYAGRLRREIEAMIPDRIEEILSCLESCRMWLPEILTEQKERGAFLKELMEMLLSAPETGEDARPADDFPADLPGLADLPDLADLPHLPGEQELRSMAEEFKKRRREP